jgi:hypothetical protein
MYINDVLTRKITLHFFLKCLFEHLEYMFIYLEGNQIILGTIMIIDAHLKNVNCVNNMKNKKIHCRNNYLKAKSKHLTHI